MSKNHERNRGPKTLSLFGFLALAGGCGLLFSYVRYIRLWRGWGESFHMPYIVLASMLILWGIQQLVSSRAKPYARNPRPRGNESHGKSSRAKSIPWLGIILTLMGLQVLFLLYWYPFAELMKWIGAAAGLALLISGVKELLISLYPKMQHSRPRRRIALPIPGAFYLVIMGVTALGAMIGRSNMMMLVFSLMAGPYVVNGWFVYSMLKRTRVHRIAPKSVMAGEPVSVELVFENGKRFLSSWLMNAGDQISNENELLQAGVLFARIPPRSKQSGHYRMRLMQRGWYRLGPIRLNTRFPLGLVERGLIFNEYSDILVFPRLGRLLPAWNRDTLNAPQLIQRREPKPGAFDDEFHRIREYHSGDNPRAIHWRTSARLNELMVREFTPTRERNLVVLLDLHLPAQPREEDKERVELAISFAATVCVEHMRQSRQSKVVVASAGEEFTIWEGAAGPGGMESLLETLAQIQAGRKPDIEKLLDETAIVRTAETRSVFVTTRAKNEKPSEYDEEISQSRRKIFDSGNEITVISANHKNLSHFFQLA